MSLQLLDNQTRLAPNEFFPQLGGGGGGGSNIVANSVDSITASISTMNVLTINGLSGAAVDAPDGLNVGGAGLNMSNNPISFGAGSLGVVFLANDGVLTGVSTINSQPYPPSGGAYPAMSSIIGDSGVPFTNVSANSDFVTSQSVFMKLANQYIVSADLTYSIGDSTTGLIFQGSQLTGGAVGQSNQNGGNLSWIARPVGTDVTTTFRFATTSGTPASGVIRNLVITDLGPRGSSLP